MHDLVIYGTGGLGREVAEMIRRINERHRFWNLLGFVDDNEKAEAAEPYLLLGNAEFIENFSRPLDVVLAIAAPKAKMKIYERLKNCPHVHFPNVIDTDTKLSNRVTFEEGVVISHFCSVSVGVRLGCCVFLNTGTHVGHDVSLGAFCSVMPSVNISGGVTVGNCTLIGVGSSILQGLEIGANTTVGMGSVVIGNVPSDCTVFGNPAKKL